MRQIQLFVLFILLVASIAFPLNFNDTPISASGQELTRAMSNWDMINYGQYGRSHSPQSIINQDNADNLEMKWIYPYPPTTYPTIPGSIRTYAGSGSPVLIVDGVAYSATNQRALVAVDAASGSLIWNNVVAYDNDVLQQTYPHVKGMLPHTHAVNYYDDKGIIIPSLQSCQVDGHDSLIGDVVFSVMEMCGTEEEAQAWGNQGYYASIGTHPPQFYDDIMVVPVMGSSGNGGRSFIAGYDVSDMDNPKRIWQTFLMPPAQGDPDWALHHCDIGYFFSYPEWLDTGRLGVPCNEVPEENLKNDWINPQSSRGMVHTASSVATVWGHYLIDQETGLVYLGTGESGPYPNALRRPGVNLYGSAIVALDAKTGEFVWWYQTVPHDMWDYDCAWNAILGEVEGKKAIFKGCKNGFMYALDAATGEPFWIYHPPDAWLPQPGMSYPDPKNIDDLQRAWPTSHVGETSFTSANFAGILEADMAYDGERLYLGSYNMPVTVVSPEYPEDFGNQLVMLPTSHPTNSSIYALDTDTGEELWRFFIDGAGFRGGLTVSGGVVYVPSGDGWLYLLNSETGEILSKRSFGIGLWTQATIGADSQGDMKVFVNTGGMSIASWGQTGIPGAMIALGLGDESSVVISEEVVVAPADPAAPVSPAEVQEVVTEIETIRTETVISPLSYLMIIISFIILAISATMFITSGNWKFGASG